MSYTSDNVSLIRSNTNSTAFDSGDIWTASNNGSSIISLYITHRKQCKILENK